MKMLSLSFIALVFGGLLSATHHITSEQIEANRQAFELRQMQEVVGNEAVLIKPQNDQYSLYLGHEKVGALRMVSTTQGYNGTNRFWLATSVGGEVLGVRIVEHHETPGLGDKLELSVSDWVLGFEGTTRQSHRWDVKKFGGDFDQFSGATITPRAVILAIEEALEAQP